MISLKTASAVLGRCFLIFAGIQILGFGLFYCCHEWAYGIHSSIFTTITPEAYEQMVCNVFAAMKVLGITFFLVPWLAIKMIPGEEG